MLKIEKGIPLPISNRDPRKYDWGKMEIGDSFFIKTKNKNLRVSAMTSSVNWRKKNNPNARFSTRLVKGGFRVWRIK